jgi:pyruvate dehydrogenase E2 component (dihydrolipoamide acetyltransferase)
VIHEVILPVLGETMNEGTVVQWQKAEGAPVRVGDVLYTLETDKTTLEVEAQAAGFLRRILVPAGNTVPVLTPVALITATPNEDLSHYAPRPAGSAPAAPGASPAPSLPPAQTLGPMAGGRRFISPRARRRARQEGLDLGSVAGSGPGGRITERDVAARLARGRETGPPPKATPLAQRAARDLHVDLAAATASGPGGRITLQDVRQAAALPREAELIPLSRARKLAAERMTASFTSAPHFYLHAEVDVRRLAALRATLLPQIEAEAGVRLTYTDLLVKLSAATLAKHPQVMAHWTPDGLRPAPAVNIGVAVETPAGLIVPVIRQADGLSLSAVARARSDLAERGRAGRLTPADLEAGVFTLSNLGMFRVDFFDAILNPPQAAILAVGRIAERAMVEDGQVIVAPRMTLSLSVDHRVLDGAAAARFLGDLVEAIEDPSPVLL